jgi:amidohydrolase
MTKRINSTFSFIALALLAAMTIPGTLWSQDWDIQNLARKVEPKVIEWRREIHARPELSNREFETAAMVARHLESLGMEVTTGVAHTGVVGLLRGGLPGAVVALRADMDALPVTENPGLPFASTVRSTYNGQDVGVMHACGHDTHVAMLMGVAEILAPLKDAIPGTIKFIFQPAEEGPPLGEEGGAKMMVAEGVLDNPATDAIFGLHITSGLDTGLIGYRSGGLLASADVLRISVHGKQTHGSTPWQGIDPITTSAYLITALQSIVSRQLPLTTNAAVISIGAIHGGVRSNIIPAVVEMEGTIRTLDPDMQRDVHEKIHRTAQGVAQSMGAEINVTIDKAAPVTYNHPELTRRSVPSLESAAGPENVIVMPAITGAEDFSFFAEKIPAFFFFLGGKPPDLPMEQTGPHHAPDFFVEEDAFVTGVAALSELALDYLNSHQP